VLASRDLSFLVFQFRNLESRVGDEWQGLQRMLYYPVWGEKHTGLRGHDRCVLDIRHSRLAEDPALLGSEIFLELIKCEKLGRLPALGKHDIRHKCS